jgi:hypothetical protein
VGVTDETTPDVPPAAADPASPEQIEPLHVPMLRIIEVGLAAWVVALVVTLVVPALHQGDRDWWPWTCVAGFVLGCLGWAYVRRGRGNARDAA